jgi:hypothetical protein
MEFVAEVVKRDEFIDFKSKEEEDNFVSQLSTDNKIVEEKFF